MSINDFDIEWKLDYNPVDYAQAIVFMRSRVNDIINYNSKPLIWLTYHDDIYTAGISAKKEELLNINTSIPIYRTNRGGKYTFHGKGIRMIYIMINLKKLFYPYNPDVSKFINFLEIWIISVLEQVNIESQIIKDEIGVWIKENNKKKKIASIGIRLQKWISYHGIALNVSPNLKMFQDIIPCGIKDCKMTSIFDLNRVEIEDLKLDKIIKTQFYKNLSIIRNEL